jgi:hypothetical protein
MFFLVFSSLRSLSLKYWLSLTGFFFTCCGRSLDEGGNPWAYRLRLQRGGGICRRCRLGHAHHRIRDLVGFAFIWVMRLADSELGL